MVRWGILGCGSIAQKFVDDLKQVDGCKLVAAGSRNIEKAKAFQELNNAELSFGSYKELAQCEEVDVIYIATPHPMHKANTILCLENGKHVLCEKPFAMNVEEVKEMVEAAKSNKRFLMEAIWTQFLPYMQKLKQVIRDGAIGEIQMIEADFGFKADYNPNGRLFNPSLGGGALLDIGIYPLFLCHTLLGKPDEISASAQIGDTGVDESSAMNLKWKSGAMASLLSTVLCDTKCEAKIFGTEAYIEIDSRWHESKSFSIKNRDGILEKFQFNDSYKGYAYEIMAVNKSIQKGELENPELTLEFSLNLMKDLDSIRSYIGLTYPNNA